MLTDMEAVTFNQAQMHVLNLLKKLEELRDAHLRTPYK